MSGGCFDYKNDTLCGDIFDWKVDADYGLGESKSYHDDIRYVRDKNKLEDKIISELVYDVFCLLHSYDWYVSGDTDENIYRDDIKYFKNKWLKNLKSNKEYIKNLIDEELDRTKKGLYTAFDVDDTNVVNV